jgi:hypothetical protein
VKIPAILLIAAASLGLCGCDVGDMVDSKVLTNVQEYFPLAEVRHTQKGVLNVDTRVGNVTEKFGAKVFQSMLSENSTQLQFGLGLAGYTTLIVGFEDFVCFWSPEQRANQFTCIARFAKTGRVYRVNEHLSPFVR